MFENIAKFFKKLVKSETKDTPSKDTAKERLHLVLMQDRANVSADFLELMKQEIIEVIKKYIEVEETAIDVRLTNEVGEDGTKGAPSLYANIPILNIKNGIKNESEDNKKEDNKEVKESKEEKKQENKEEIKEDKQEQNKKDDENDKIEKVDDNATEETKTEENKEVEEEQKKDEKTEQKVESINEPKKEENKNITKKKSSNKKNK